MHDADPAGGMMTTMVACSRVSDCFKKKMFVLRRTLFYLLFLCKTTRGTGKQFHVTTKMPLWNEQALMSVSVVLVMNPWLIGMQSVEAT